MSTIVLAGCTPQPLGNYSPSTGPRVVFKSVESKHGSKYVVDGRISGRSPMVRSVCIVDRGLDAPRLSSTDLDPNSCLNVANVIVAELNESDPRAVAQAAKEAARARWRSFAEQVFSRHQAAIQRDTIATLKGKQPAGGSRVNEVEDFIRTRVTGADSLRRLADELLVARQIALAVGQARGGTMGRDEVV